MNKNHPSGCYHEGLPFYLWAVLVFSAVAISLSLIEGVNNESPPLVGIGCIGATGPIYAHEESDLPECSQIVRRQ